VIKKKPVARRQRRSHTPEFKARVALAAMREDKTMLGWEPMTLSSGLEKYLADRLHLLN
jgi:transposase-like protein